MPFNKMNLYDTWFEDLHLEELRISKSQLPPKESIHPWQCAIDEEHRILFTQLISDTYAMRDGLYYYLLAIKNDLVLIFWDNHKAVIKDRGSANKYKLQELKDIINEAAAVVVLKLTFAFKWEKEILK